MSMDKESQLLISHLSDLADETAFQYYCTFSDFLNLNEQSVFFENRDKFLHVSFEMSGGCECAERRMIKFFNDYCGELPYPIVCIKIQAVSEKFSDRFTHRDFLGAVLNLGISRSKIGDMIIEDNKAYMFVSEPISQYICDSLEKVKHTKVTAVLSEIPQAAVSPKFKTKQGTVSSIRIDSLISLAFNLSRTNAVRYIAQGLVFINGKLVTGNHTIPKNNDIISVRTLGRFKLETTDLKSKKDKFIVKIHVYI